MSKYVNADLSKHKKDLLNVEKCLLKYCNSKLFVLLYDNLGKNVLGIFSTRDNAHRHMIRRIVDLNIDCFDQIEEDDKDNENKVNDDKDNDDNDKKDDEDKDKEDNEDKNNEDKNNKDENNEDNNEKIIRDKKYWNRFFDFCKDDLENHKIFEIDHIDPTKPIYVCQNGNYCIFDEPTSYLTNSLDEWKNHQQTKWKNRDIEFRKSWKRQCTITIDPELTKYNSFIWEY